MRHALTAVKLANVAASILVSKLAAVPESKPEWLARP
jgi:hypothetical protein